MVGEHGKFESTDECRDDCEKGKETVEVVTIGGDMGVIGFEYEDRRLWRVR